mmetsp:Transcript_11933/g.25971  ORF Transcript_11933/g.25971 Transcript_11933/m.25971 type:complete len:213 (-) Transcript_11933:1418-2056(-)
MTNATVKLNSGSLFPLRIVAIAFSGDGKILTTPIMCTTVLKRICGGSFPVLLQASMHAATTVFCEIDQSLLNAAGPFLTTCCVLGLKKKGDQLPHQLPLHGHTRTGVRCGDGLGLPTRLLCCCTSHTELKADQGTKNNFRTAKQSHHEDLANFLMQWFLVRKVKQTLQNLRRSPPPRIWTSGCHSIQCRRIGGFFCVDLECVHARGDSQQIL